MIHLHDAIYALNPSVVTIRGDVAYDANEQEISYDLSVAEAKLTEMQSAETAAKNAALAKLTALGLTPADLTALGL
jgi:hypothetical protein